MSKTQIVSRTHLENGVLVSAVRLPDGEYEVLVFPYPAATIEVDGQTNLDTLEECLMIRDALIARWSQI